MSKNLVRNKKKLDFCLDCCVYDRPHEFGESSSESSDAGDVGENCHGGCRGHKQKNKNAKNFNKNYFKQTKDAQVSSSNCK